MKTRQLYTIILLTLLITGCTSAKKSSVQKDVSVNVPLDSTGHVDLEKLFVNTKEIVQANLPKAEYGSTSLKVPCDDTSLSQGMITFLFKERRKIWLGLKEQVLFSYVFIDVQNGSLDFSIIDQTDHYPSLSRYAAISNADFYDVLGEIHNHLERNGFESCSLSVSQMDDYWDVSVLSNDNTEYLDIFGIKADNKQVIDYPIVK